MRSAIIAIALASMAAASQAATSKPIANDALVHSARMWEAHDRSDLAMLALKKWVAARPDSPEALLELGELALRVDDVATAQSVLNQLQTRFGHQPAASAFEVEYRFATSDRLQLASLQRLIETSRTSQARNEFARLFPRGAPQGYLSIEYYSLLARLPGTWQRVHDDLQRLSEQHPDEPRYGFALARHLLRRDDTALQGVRALDELTQRDDLRASEVDDALIVGLKQLGAQTAPFDILQRYVQRHREDAEAANLLAQSRAYQQQELQWRRNALALIAPDLRVVGDAQVAAELNTRRKANADLDEALNALHALERELPAKQSSLEQTLAPWKQRGEQSLASSKYGDAKLELAIALALCKQAFESTIGFADELETRGRILESGELLTTASDFDPSSNWLFETRVRWLIKHGEETQALSLLAQRPITDRYTAAKRDELRAAALSQRAERNSSTTPAETINDLQAALNLSTSDVWLRYRLAKLYAQQGRIDQARALMNAGAATAPHDPQMRYAQALLLASLDDNRDALDALRFIDVAEQSEAMRELQQRLELSIASQEIDRLIEQQRFDEAGAKLDMRLAQSPSDRELRLQRADLEWRAHHFQAARDRYAVLVAEQPDDVETRLAYVRTLIESGDLSLARLQLQAARQQAPADDAKLQLTIAWRAWSLDDAQTTAEVLAAVLPQLDDNADAWLLAGRSDIALRQFNAAHTHLLHAEQLNAGASSDDARTLRQTVDARMDDVLTVAAQARHKAGDAGISQFDSVTIPSAWQWALNYRQRLTLRADAVQLDAGSLSKNFSDAASFGTIYSAGASAPRIHENTAQRGVALGLVHDTDFTTLDLGTTPLGFDLPQIVGGVEWRPDLKSLDIKLGLSRRAVTSSVLSYAGMRDPVTGIKWGGVVATGPYLQAGLYRQQYSVSGALRVSQLSGTHVLGNQFIAARAAGDYRWLERSQDASWLGVTVNYWHYAHNLQNYTFGSGGYYSPQQYMSVALPIEWQGSRQSWSYQARAALAYSHSRVERTAFYPNDLSLQQQAILQAQANNDSEPWFSVSNGGGVSFSASAKLEYRVSEHLVAGGEFSLDHADYYHPVELSIYIRRVFGGAATLNKPPSGLRPYND